MLLYGGDVSIVAVRIKRKVSFGPIEKGCLILRGKYSFISFITCYAGFQFRTKLRVVGFKMLKCIKTFSYLEKNGIG